MKEAGGAPFESHGNAVAVQVFARVVTQPAANRAEEVVRGASSQRRGRRG